MTLEVRCGAANPDAQRKRDPAAVARNQAAYGKFSAVDPAAWDAAMRIQSALEQAGVRFLPDEPGHGGIGVRLTGPAQRSLPLS